MGLRIVVIFEVISYCVIVFRLIGQGEGPEKPLVSNYVFSVVFLFTDIKTKLVNSHIVNKLLYPFRYEDGYPSAPNLVNL